MGMTIRAGYVAVLATVLLAAPTTGATETLPPVEVFVPNTCIACIDWAEHLRENGFTVRLIPTDDMATVKRRLKVPVEVESVHTAVVAGYFVEGHVPADDVKMLLREKPRARGIAVPGLPFGAPGRETSSPSCERGCTMLDSQNGEGPVRRELYDTLLVDPKGRTTRYARH